MFVCMSIYACMHTDCVVVYARAKVTKFISVRAQCAVAPIVAPRAARAYKTCAARGSRVYVGQ